MVGGIYSTSLQIYQISKTSNCYISTNHYPCQNKPELRRFIKRNIFLAAKMLGKNTLGDILCYNRRIKNFMFS